MGNDETRNLTEADNIIAMIESAGWKSVKGKLDIRILDLQNINNLDISDVSTLATQLAARKMASEIIFDWLKQDVYGFVEQQTTNTVKLSEPTEDFIERE